MDNRNLILFLFLLLFSTFNVMAIGINSPYWDANPLKMHPGETKDVEFTLVNSIEEKTESKVSVSFIETAGIAKLSSGLEYTIAPGSSSKIKLTISIPKNANIGSSYNVAFLVKSAPLEQEGTVQLGLGYIIKLPIIISSESEIQQVQEQNLPAENKEKSNTNTILIISLLVTIIIISSLILYLIYKRNKSR